MNDNLIGIHWITLTSTWDEEGCRKAIAEAKRIGYSLIELPPLEPGAAITRFTRDRLAEAGLASTVGLGLSEEQDITSPDPEKRAAGEAFLSATVDMCAEVGATMISGITYSAFRKYMEPSTAEGRNHSIEVIRRVAEKGAKAGVSICLEVVNRYETNLLNTAAQATAFCRDVGLPNVKVHLDTYHMNIEETDVYQAIVDCGPHLGFFHVGETNRGYLGAGNIDFNPYFRGLAKAGYKGPVSFESFSSSTVSQPLLGILGIWRDVWEDGIDLAEHSFDFIQAHLKAAREVVARS